jgi:tetratricopeptide (TPR) repeat protein
VAVGLLVGAALVVGLSLAIVGFVQANRERKRTQMALARAEANFKLAREAVEEMTRAADEQLSFAPTAPLARRLLQQTQVFYGRVLEERSDDPAAREQAGLAYKRLARIQEALGEYEQSEQAYRLAIDVFEKLAEDFPETARYQVCIVRTMENRESSLNALGHDKEADEIRTALRDMVKGLVRRFPHDSLCRKVFVEECRRQDSRRFYEDAIARFEELLAGHPSCRYELAMLLVYIGTFLKDEGRLEEAIEANQKAEAIRQELVALLPRLSCETRRLHMPWPDTGWLCLTDYKVRITQAGQYQLYVRSARHDGASNSFYAWIDELADGPGGTVADWYMCITGGIGANFANIWKDIAHFERVSLEVRDSGPAVWQIAAPGDYTITLAPRKDGVAIDAFVFQLAGLPDPEGDGPEESPMTKEKVFLESNGRVVVEAEHFTDRTPFECAWVVVPGEDAGDTAHINFRGAGYIQALPDMSPSEGQWQILTDKGDTQSELGLWDKAIADYSEALAIMPDYEPALIGRGKAYAESDQWDKAIADYSKVIADYSKAIELDPNNSDAWCRRGWVYQDMEQWDESIADFSKAIELSPDHAPKWHHRANSYADSGQWDKAIAGYSQAISLEADEIGHWGMRARAYSEIQRWDKAVADYLKIIELTLDGVGSADRSELPGIYGDLAHALEKMGRLDEAEDAYKKAEEWRRKLRRGEKEEPEETEDRGQKTEDSKE